MTADTGAGARRSPPAALRLLLLATILLVLAQAVLGMAVNLYVTVPPHHPGAHPASYLTGSYQSVQWALAHGEAALAAHASLGLGLVVLAVSAAVLAARRARRVVAIWSVLGGLLVIGAGFNGASFLDFGGSISSLIMAALCFAAVACFAVALFLLGVPGAAGGPAAGTGARPG